MYVLIVGGDQRYLTIQILSKQIYSGLGIMPLVRLARDDFLRGPTTG
jgi:hypothetical protein